MAQPWMDVNGLISDWLNAIFALLAFIAISRLHRTKQESSDKVYLGHELCRGPWS